MTNFFTRGLRAMIFAGLLSSQGAWGQQPNPFVLPGLHPGYSVTNLLNGSNYGLPTSQDDGQPNVGAMCWLPDGRLFIATQTVGTATGNYLGPSSAYIFNGVQGGTISLTGPVAGGFYLPSGCVALSNTEVYVVDNQTGLVKLTNNGGATWTKSTVYGGILGQVSAGGSGDRHWDAGLKYVGGNFYASVGVGIIQGGTSENGANQVAGRGAVVRIPLAGGSSASFAGGIRNGGGMGVGPGNEIFLTDNQGSWKPASPMYNPRQGRWYGHPDTPFGPSGSIPNGTNVSPPVVIFPYGASTNGSPATDPALARSPTDILMLPAGTYAGQLLVGEIYLGGLNRVFLENVNGEYQGVIFPFSQGLGNASSAGSGGFSAPVHGMLIGSDNSTIFLGGGGGEGSGSSNWGVPNRNHWGLARMAPNGNPVFEMKAIRSLNSTTMEIEFTEPVTAAATSNFTVHHWNYTVGGSGNNNSYGAGKNGTSQLTVSGASLSADRTRVTLTINGLQQLPSNNGRNWPYVVQFQVSGVTSSSGRSLWGGQAWYTLNRFGPATVTAIPEPGANGVEPRLKLHWTGNGALVRFPVPGDYTLHVRDLLGKSAADFRAHGSEFLLPASALPRGLFTVEAHSARGRWKTTASRL